MGRYIQRDEDRKVASGFGCMEVTLKAAVPWRRAEARLEWIQEYVGGEALETVSMEHTFQRERLSVKGTEKWGVVRRTHMG